MRQDLEDGRRVCSSCNKPKEIKEFPVDKRCSLGHTRKCNKCIKKYRKKTLDKKETRKYKKNWYQNNRGLTLKRQQERYQENKEQIKAYSRQYAKDNPLVGRAASHKRRAAKRNNGRNDLTAKQIRKLFKDFPRCAYCGIEHNLTIDHFIPISKGGENTLENVVSACMNCNNKKKAKLVSVDILRFDSNLSRADSSLYLRED